MNLLRRLLAVLSGARNRAVQAPAAVAATRSAPLAAAARERVSSRPGEVAAAIRGVVREWRGVPYKMGGTDRAGVDCSAFVRRLYGEHFGVDLPRTSRQQAEQGRSVSRDELAPGDLVFFKVSERTRHVGAYLGNGEFGHASTSKGPIVSRLDNVYWRDRFWTARRVL